MKQQEENRIWDYVDGFLPATEQAKMESLFARDPEARKFLAEIQQLKSRMESLPAEKPSAAFTMNVLGAMAAEAGEVRPYRIKSDTWIIKCIVFTFLGFIAALTGIAIGFGSAHQVQHVSLGLAYTSSTDIIHLMSNKLVTVFFFIIEAVLLLAFADIFLKKFSLKKDIA